MLANQKRSPERLRTNRRNWDWNNPEKTILNSARSRATKAKLKFNLEVKDMVIPEYCPVLGIKLIKSENKVSDNSPTLDRINNSKGYIKGNVVVVSYKANRIKNNATIDELKKVYLYYDSISNGCS